YYYIYKAMKRESEALQFYEKYHLLRDSLSKVQNKEEILRIQMNYEAEKKENEIALLQATQAKQTAELRFRSLAIYTLVGLLVIAISIFIFWRRKLALKQELKKQTMLTQIASDLHDDVGASLSAIKMLGEIIHKKSVSEHLDIAPLAQKIAGNSEEIIHAMSDIVWAIKPENNDVKALHDKLFQTAVDCCSSSNISIRFLELSEALATKNLDVEIKKDIYLMTKEAIHNAAKYSEASLLEVSMQLQGNLLKISVKDNGKGFDKDWTNGNGIKNMKARCAKYQGEMQIISHQQGVEICFSIPLPD
ncbi:MAG: sensor histidine kinase, partial [Flavobacteriales bacterium]